MVLLQLPKVGWLTVKGIQNNSDQRFIFWSSSHTHIHNWTGYESLALALGSQNHISGAEIGWDIEEPEIAVRPTPVVKRIALFDLGVNMDSARCDHREYS